MTSVTRLDHAYAVEIVSSPYMESGFMQHIMIAPLGERTYEVSDLVYGSEQGGGGAQGFVKAVDGVVTGAEPLGERKSNAILDSYFPKPLYTTSPNGFFSDTPIYSHDTGLPDRKKAQSTIRSSWYTGLLQNYVQARFGSGLGGYGLTDEGFSGFGGFPRLVMDGQTLEFWGKESHWIYLNRQTAPNGSSPSTIEHHDVPPLPLDGYDGLYWEDTTTKLWYGPRKNKVWGEPYPLTRHYWLARMSADGQVLFTLLETKKIACAGDVSGLAGRKLHALFLGQAKLTQTVKKFKVEPPIGDTLAYGWHANEDGSEVQAVLNGPGNPDADIVSGAGYTRRYSLKIAGGSDGSPESVKMTIVSEGKWAVSNDVHCLAFPSLQIAKETYVGGDYEYACDAPIYVVYRDGQFKEFRIRGAQGEAGTVGLGDMTGSVSSPADWRRCVVTNGGGDSAIPPQGNGIVDDPQEFFPDDWYQRMFAWYGHSVGLEGGGAALPPNLPPRDDGNQEQRISEVTAMSWGMTYDVKLNERAVCKPLLVVPFNDCEAVLSGKQAGTYYTSKSGGVYSIPEAPKKITFQKRFWPYPAGPWGPWEEQEIVTLADADTVGAWYGSDAAEHMRNSFLSSFSVSLYSDPNPSFDIEQEASVLTKNTQIPVDPISDVYFQPSLGIAGDPNDNPSYVGESLGLSYEYSLGHGESGSSDWPAGNAVGWA